MFKQLSVLACLALSGCISPVDVATLPVPAVESSADRSIDSPKGSFEEKIYATEKKPAH